MAQLTLADVGAELDQRIALQDIGGLSHWDVPQWPVGDLVMLGLTDACGQYAGPEDCKQALDLAEKYLREGDQGVRAMMEQLFVIPLLTKYRDARFFIGHTSLYGVANSILSRDQVGMHNLSGALRARIPALTENWRSSFDTSSSHVFSIDYWPMYESIGQRGDVAEMRRMLNAVDSVWQEASSEAREWIITEFAEVLIKRNDIPQDVAALWKERLESWQWLQLEPWDYPRDSIH